jgi:hypothetical protein
VLAARYPLAPGSLLFLAAPFLEPPFFFEPFLPFLFEPFFLT